MRSDEEGLRRQHERHTLLGGFIRRVTSTSERPAQRLASSCSAISTSMAPAVLSPLIEAKSRLWEDASPKEVNLT